jgi:hypothetical protein
MTRVDRRGVPIEAEGFGDPAAVSTSVDVGPWLCVSVFRRICGVGVGAAERTALVTVQLSDVERVDRT